MDIGGPSENRMDLVPSQNRIDLGLSENRFIEGLVKIGWMD